MKHIAFWTAVILLSGMALLLSESGCQIVTGSSVALDRERDTELALRELIEGTFDQRHPSAADLWGTKLNITEVDDLRWTTSAGPDKTFGTIDDIRYSSTAPR